MKKKVTLIGCGWLGLPLGINLLKNGYTVFGSTQSVEKVEYLSSLGLNGFLYSEENLTHIPNEAKLSDLLIINFPPSKSADYAKQISDLIQVFSNDTKVIFTSSTSVYKDIDGQVNEQSELNETHPVSLAEQSVINSNHAYCIFRLAGLIDENRHPIKFLSGRETQNALGRVNLVHKIDVISAIETQLDSTKWNTVYNVCSPEHPTRKEYYTKSAEFKGLPHPIFNSEGSTGKEISSQKLIESLGFQFTQSIFF
jgi:nucleoside-diphosphate-sugar epimerase